jgi:hypothetical protein
MTPESQAVSRSFVIDSTDPRELAIFASACVLAKHLAYAFGDAYFTIPTTTTPVSLWLATNPVGKDVWIRHAMEWLRSQDPIQQGPIFVTGLRGKVIGQISPAPAAPRVREHAARPPAGEQRALPPTESGTEAPPTLCIYCTDRAIDPAHFPYCSTGCAVRASCEGD